MKVRLILFFVVILFLAEMGYFILSGRILEESETASLPVGSLSTPTITQQRSGFSELMREMPPKVMVGLFQEWENIPGSSDRYLILVSRQNRQLFPKARVLVDSTSFFSKNTLFFTAEIKTREIESREEVIMDTKTNEISLEEFVRLVDPEDIINVFLRQLPSEESNVVDENSNFLAERVWLVKNE